MKEFYNKVFSLTRVNEHPDSFHILLLLSLSINIVQTVISSPLIVVLLFLLLLPFPFFIFFSLNRTQTHFPTYLYNVGLQRPGSPSSWHQN